MSGTPVHAIRDFAFLADGERGALVDPQGEIQWLCFPGWADEPVFGSLFGLPGSYTVRPGGRYTWGGYYEEGTLIWRSRWTLDSGAIVESRETLSFPGDRRQALILRRIVGVQGRARIHAVLTLASGWAPTATIPPAGVIAPGTWRWRQAGCHARWTCGEGARPAEGGVGLDFDIQEGEERDLVLELAGEEPEHQLQPAAELWEATAQAWQAEVPDLDSHGARREARTSFAVLRGLTSGGSGLVASCTTSLPERLDSGRLYDYRYVWIRDQVYAGRAGATLGGGSLLENATRFVSDRLLEDGPGLRPVYTVEGGVVPEEKTLEIPGYPGARPVTVGNRSGRQFQLDCFGEALLLFASAAGHDLLQGREFEAARKAAQAIEQRWNEEDAGVWEQQPRWWTHSRLICAAGLKALALALPSEEGARWTLLADSLLTQAGQRSLRDDGGWRRAEDDERVDASLLLAAIRGALPGHDPRSVCTLQAVQRQLVQDGFCWRFRSGEQLGEGEGAFTLCGFWMALAHLQCGERAEAGRWFERSSSACGPAGLFSEEYDPAQRQQRGNLPQAFVHAGLLECVGRMAEA